MKRKYELVLTGQFKKNVKLCKKRGLPSVLFIPMEGQPMMQVGAMPEEGYQKVIEEKLLK